MSIFSNDRVPNSPLFENSGYEEDGGGLGNKRKRESNNNNGGDDDIRYIHIIASNIKEKQNKSPTKKNPQKPTFTCVCAIRVIDFLFFFFFLLFPFL